MIGHELSANPKVGMVSLTGSVGAGQQTMAAAAPNITKVSLELGGKAPAIVMKDADVDLAVKSIIASRVINTGQVCNCAERVYVDKAIKETFMEKLVAGMKQVKVGNPNEIADLDMGPLIEASALKSMEKKVERAIQQGARLLCGGHRIGTKDISSNRPFWIVLRRKWISYKKRLLAPCYRLSNIRTSTTLSHGRMIANMD